MPDREGDDWSDGGDVPLEVSFVDSIAAQVAARIEAPPAVPGDALDWAAIAAGYEREAAARGDAASAAPLLFEAGRVFEERLGAPADALSRYRRAFERDPAFRPNLHAARRVATHLGDDALVVALLAAEERLEADPDDRADLAAHRARWLLALGRTAEASAALAEARGSEFAVAEASANAAAAARDPAALADAWTRCAGATRDATLASQYLGAAATVLDEALGDRGRAAALFASAFERRPDDPYLRAAAQQAAVAAGRWEDLATLLRAEAEGASGRGAAEAWSSLAWVARTRLGRPDEALACLVRAARAAPDCPDVLRELAHAHGTEGDAAGESETLARLADLLAGRASPAERREAVDALLRRAILEELRGRVPQAVAACREALLLAPGERSVLSLLGRLSARVGDFEGVASAFLAEADVAGDAAERARLLLRAAEVMEGRLGRSDEALAALREALAFDPTLLAARDALERLLARTGDWGEIVALLEADLEAPASPRERVADLFRVGQLQEERLLDPGAAAATWRRLLEIDPEHLTAVRALSRCLEALGAGEELVDALGRELALVEAPRRRVALHARRAEILEERLGDAVRARGEWDRVLGLDPGHLPAQRALGRLLAREGRDADLVALLHREADAAPTPDAAASILVRAGAIIARQPDGEAEAVALYQEALTLAPEHLGALEALAGIHRRRRDVEPLVEILRARAVASPVPEIRAATWLEAGRIYDERLGDVQQAATAYEAAIAANPADGRPRAALERLRARGGDSASLRTLRAAPEALSSPEWQARRVAMELTAGGDPSSARAAAEALGRMRARGAPALLALAGGLPAAGRAKVRTMLSEGVAAPSDVVVLLMSSAAEQAPGAARDALLARAATIAPDRVPLLPHAAAALRKDDAPRAAARLDEAAARAGEGVGRAHLRVRAGEAWERAGDVDRALASYRAALADAPDDLPALRAARTLFARLGDWAAARATLHAEAAARRDPAGSAAAWLQAGAIAEERFADVESAARDYRRAAERDPSDPTPLRCLEALGAAEGRDELVALKRTLAEAEPDPARAAAGWLEYARLASQSGAGAGEVLDALDRAVALDPRLAPALELRGRVRAEEGRSGEAADDFEACLALVGEPSARLPLHLATAAVLQESGEDPARTARHLEAAVELSPESTEALGRLARLHLDRQELPSAAAALRRLASLPSLPPAARAEHLLALAPVEAARGDLPAAAEACRRALEGHPGDARALRLLAELEGRRENPSGLAEALETAAETAPDPAARIDARVALARVLADRLDDPGRAIAQLTQALATAPEREDARVVLAHLLEEQRSPQAVQEHRALLAASPARVDSWTALYRLFSQAGARDRAWVAAGVLRWLGAPSPDPAADALLDEEGRRAPPGAVPVLREADWDLLRHPAERGPLSDVVGAAGAAIASVLEPPAPADAPFLRADHPLRETVGAVAQALGVDGFELRAGPPGRVTLAAGEPPVLTVGLDLPRRATVAEQRFLLGRALALARMQAHVVDALPPGSLGPAVAAAARLFVPGYCGTGRPTEDLVRRIGKALGRKARRALEPAATALAGVRPSPDASTWRAAADLTADRAAALLCGDVPAALTLALERQASGGAHPPPAARAAAAMERADVAALLAFAASEEHFVLRQRLGVARG